MATSVIYALLDALVSAARTAMPTVTIYDGFGVSDDPGNFLMIGVDDPDRPDAANAADSAQTAGPMSPNRPRDENGEVTCCAVSWNGDADPSAARAGCKAITDGVENLIRTVATPPLGVTGLLWLGWGTTTQLTQDQNESGAWAMVLFKIQFRARI